MESRSNFFLFIMVSLVILVVWIWLQTLWRPAPPEDKKDKKDVAEKKKPKEAPPPVAWKDLSIPAKKAAVYAGSVATPLPWTAPAFLGTMAGNASLVAQVKDLKDLKEQSPPVAWKNLPIKAKKIAAYAGSIATPFPWAASTFFGS